VIFVAVTPLAIDPVTVTADADDEFTVPPIIIGAGNIRPGGMICAIDINGGNAAILNDNARTK
jgi:hypothetical protein